MVVHIRIVPSIDNFLLYVYSVEKGKAVVRLSEVI